MKSDMENRDWLNDYELLKQVNPVTPFSVPADYFDGLEDRIVTGINLFELKKTNTLSGFTVPENYFEKLSANIQTHIRIANHLTNDETGFQVPTDYFEGLSADIQKRVHLDSYLTNDETGFQVPADYFEGLSVDIQNRIYLDNYLASNETGFTVPADYFEDAVQKIRSQIFIEEATGGQTHQYSVPEGYFDALNADILNKTVNVDLAKGKGIVRRLITSTVFKYATAACFALAIGGGILLNELASPDNIHKKSFLHKELSTIPVDEIKSYLQLNVDAGETQHMILTQSAPIDDDKLSDALQNYVDSVQ